MKQYGINIKECLKALIPGIFFLILGIFLIIVTTPQDMIQTELVMATMNDSVFYPYGCTAYIVTVLSALLIIYFLERMLYKRKNTLSFSKDGIIYYCPENGKIEIKKEDIQNLYIDSDNLLRVIVKSR